MEHDGLAPACQSQEPLANSLKIPGIRQIVAESVRHEQVRVRLTSESTLDPEYQYGTANEIMVARTI